MAAQLMGRPLGRPSMPVQECSSTSTPYEHLSDIEPVVCCCYTPHILSALACATFSSSRVAR
jgi:hypothetical protein